MNIYSGFKRLEDKETGRGLIQLTDGSAFCYPLYYFIPSISRDNKYIIYHRAEDGEVQLYKLNLENGKSNLLTQASCKKAQWRPWCIDSGK